MADNKILNNYDFSGGLNAKVSPLLLKDNECEIIQNYHLDKLGALRKRTGTKNLLATTNAQIVDNVNILNMYFFKDNVGTDYSNFLVACNDGATPTNSDVYKVASGAWSKSKQDLTTSVIPQFTTFLDYVYCVTESDVMTRSADLSTWTVATTPDTGCMGTYKFKYICVWEDRVYVLNDNSTTKHPSRISWSSLPSTAATPVITWAYDGTTASGKDAADINPDDGDSITWGEPFGPRLLVFKNKGLYRWTFGQVEPDKIIDEGTPQGLTVKQIHGICFFANEKGVWAYTGGGQPTLISRKVQPFFDELDWTTTTTAAALRAEVDNDHYYLYIGTVTVDGTTYTNCVLVYTISLNAWTIYTFPWPIKAMARAQICTTSSTYDAIYVGNDDGYVYRFLEPDTYTDRKLYNTTQPINGYIVGKEHTLNFPNDCLLESAAVVSQKALGTKANYRLNRAKEFVSWHDLKERITKQRLNGRGKTFQWSFTNNSDDVEPDQIEGYSVEFKTI